MNILNIYKPRQGGKTTDMIRRSAKTGNPIICKDKDTGRDLVHRATSMGLEIPDPIPILELLSPEPSIGLPPNKKYMIDDADVILNMIINRRTGGYLDALSLVVRNEKGHEINVYGEDINVKYGLGD